MGLIQSRFVQSPLIHGGGVLKATSAPASFIFNGTDELLTRTLSTSGASTTIFTISFWVRGTVDIERLFVSADPAGSDNFRVLVFHDLGDGSLNVGGTDSGGTTQWFEFTDADDVDLDDTWHHWVIRYDSSQGTADDRIRFYKDGSLVTDAPGSAGEPGASEAHHLFRDGNTFEIGNSVGSTFEAKRMAFMDILDGVSQDATAFGFDDSGTWTRMPYAGSYGTHGFSLDGTDGFNDVSGNGQNFTGTNMTVGDNLDVNDLPPHTV